MLIRKKFKTKFKAPELRFGSENYKLKLTRDRVNRSIRRIPCGVITTDNGSTNPFKQLMAQNGLGEKACENIFLYICRGLICYCLFKEYAYLVDDVG